MLRQVLPPALLPQTPHWTAQTWVDLQRCTAKKHWAMRYPLKAHWAKSSMKRQLRAGSYPGNTTSFLAFQIRGRMSCCSVSALLCLSTRLECVSLLVWGPTIADPWPGFRYVPHDCSDRRGSGSVHRQLGLDSRYLLHDLRCHS